MPTTSRPDDATLRSARTTFLLGVVKNLGDIDQLRSEHQVSVCDSGSELRTAIGCTLADLILGDLHLGLTDDADTQLCDLLWALADASGRPGDPMSWPGTAAELWDTTVAVLDWDADRMAD